MGDKKYHLVTPGDTIVRIAQRYDVPTCNVLSQHGQLLDPYRLRYWQEVVIHPRSTQRPTSHSVVPGETADRIAQQHKISLSHLQLFNPAVNWSGLYQGQIIALPGEQQIEERTQQIYASVIDKIRNCKNDTDCLMSQLPEIHEVLNSI